VLTDDLASVWPEVAARLQSMLRRRGVRHHDIDEIVQETATRVISGRVTYVDADDLFRWASVVGGRLAIDLRRRGARLSTEELPDRADTIDVATAAEHRVVLRAVRTRLPELSESDQAALLSSFDDEPATSRRESVRVAVARHRARRRLRILLDGLAGSAILGWLRRNRLWSAPVEAISYAAVPAAACVMITVCAWSGAAPSNASAVASTARSAPVAATYVAAAEAPTATLSTGAGHDTRPPPPPSAPPSAPNGPAVNGPYIVVEDPTGEQTRAGFRPGQASDPLWCVTAPSLSGPETRCVDSPVPLPATP
jgi:DNA-directed RNA polymerase specialized sigma24 family protein